VKMKRFIYWGIVCMMLLAACTTPPGTGEQQPESPTEGPPAEEPTQPPTEPEVDPTPYPDPQLDPTSPPQAYPLPGDTPVSSEDPLPGDMPAYLIPQSDDKDLKRETVFLELGDSGLIILESFPVQVRLHLMGNLPTPCHQLRAVVTTTEEQKRVDVELYTVVDPDTVCITVLSPFDVIIPLGSFSGGKYSVYINGELLGDFDV